MPEKISEPKKPSGLSRLIYRIPILIFRAHLGWILDTRFVLLIHKGRRSGLSHRTVLEIVRYDKKTGSCIVASGWGEKSDWCQNISVNPNITFQIKNKNEKGIAIQLTPEQSAQELYAYASQHPFAFRILARFMGYQLDGSDEDIHALGKLLPMFIFRPVSLAGEEGNGDQ